MIQILLLILKIIGIVLLAVLLLVLVLLSVVLFVPVMYRARVVHNTERTELKGRVSFLFPLVVCRFRYFEKEFSYKGRALWYVFLDSGKNKEKPVEECREEKEESLVIPESEGDSEVVGPQGGDCTEESHDGIDEEIKIKKVRVKKEKKEKKHPLELLLRLSRQKDEVKRILTKKENKQALSFAWSKVKKTLRHILPRKVKGYLIYGSGDPSSTGQILGLISILYAAMGPVLRIVPDFEQKRLECDLECKGRLQVFTLLVIFLKLYRNKELKQLLQEVKAIKEIE